VLTHELTAQFRDELRTAPTHLFIQAGVGGLAAAMADGMGAMMHPPKQLIVVEPESAACVARALSAGKPVPIDGELHTSAEMLSCGLASAPALKILRKCGAQSITVPEPELEAAHATLLQAGGPLTSPSGAAGCAGFLDAAKHIELRVKYRLDPSSIVLLVATEGLMNS
jgi:diaminopropionate ammonia-lyase